LSAQLEKVEHRNRILRLVRDGATAEQVAELLATGSPPIEVTPGEVSRLVKRYLDRIHTEDALTIEQMRTMENQRLDALWRQLMGEVRDAEGKVNLRIVDRLTRLSERRAKMNGFEAAQRHEHFIGNALAQLGLEAEHVERARQAWLDTGGSPDDEVIDGSAVEIT
jgi:hypothetical protein